MEKGLRVMKKVQESDGTWYGMLMRKQKQRQIRKLLHRLLPDWPTTTGFEETTTPVYLHVDGRRAGRNYCYY